MQIRNRSVVRPWASDCSYKMQSVLFAAIRGPDGFPKEDPSKPFIRWLRSYILKDSHSIEDEGDMPITSHGQTFMANRITPLQYDAFLGDLDPYPTHWLWHFVYALHIVALGHPNSIVRTQARQLFDEIHFRLHCRPESDDDLTRRLSDIEGRKE